MEDKQIKRLSIVDLQEHAKSHKGYLLSSAYHGISKKYHWKCKEGHEWWGKFYRNSWCRKCSYIRNGVSRRISFKEVSGFVKKKGGRFFTKRFKTLKDKGTFLCAKGHKWETSICNVFTQGSWCPFCAGNRPQTIEDMRHLANRFGGRFLSKEFRGTNNNYLWECVNDHVFLKDPNSIKGGSYCPYCKSATSENICRACFEILFEKPFPKIKPKWLKNSQGNLMELDGFCDELKIAFEYHGIGHYESCFFSPTKGILQKRQNDDRLKRILCEKNGVTLIEIPKGVTGDKILPFIKGKCIDHHLINENYIDHHKPLEKKLFSRDILNKLNEIAKLKNGEMLSRTFFGAGFPLHWKCEKGHKWKAPPSRILKGAWCKICADLKKSIKRRRGIEVLQKIALTRGGKCLSTNYESLNQMISWSCAKGHIWDASANNVLHNKSWCPECYKQNGRRLNSLKYSHADMCKIALSRKGIFLSEEYRGVIHKYNWQCEKGHVFELAPYNIFRYGRWCPVCLNKNK